MKVNLNRKDAAEHAVFVYTAIGLQPNLPVDDDDADDDNDVLKPL